MRIWHDNHEVPNEDSRIYIKEEGEDIFVGVFNEICRGYFEMQSLDYEKDVSISISGIVKWAYIEDLENIV